MMDDFQLLFRSPAPGVLRPSSLALTLWFPVEDCTGDVVLFPSHDMFNSFLWPLHDDGLYAVLDASGEHMIEGSSRQENTQMCPEICVEENGQLDDVTFCHLQTL